MINYSYGKKQTVGIENWNEERNCLCGQKILLSSILDINFQCVHRIFISEEFPECPTLDIQFKPHWDELIVETIDNEDNITLEKV